MQTREQIEAAYAEGRITLEQAARMLFELGPGAERHVAYSAGEWLAEAPVRFAEGAVAGVVNCFGVFGR